MTCIFNACSAVRFDAFFTACAGQVVLRLCAAARAVNEAAASLITFRRKSELRLLPLESIGVEEPMFVVGAIASTSAAWEIHTPADAARAPSGEAETVNGTFDASSAV